VPSLTRQREATLARRAAAGSRPARDELIEGCLPSIAAMARQYGSSSTIGRDELLQCGVLGLLRALRRYDADRGTPFWAYASWWVRQSMQQLIAELAYPVVLSDRALRDLASVHRAQRRHGADASANALARECGLPADHVGRLLAVDRAAAAVDASASAEDDGFERVEQRLAAAQLSGLPGGLTTRERAVVRAHFGLGQARRSLPEIGSEFGISGERVRQIEARALEKVRDAALGGSSRSSPRLP
jgi:RNA polymerase primary sigma factor